MDIMSRLASLCDKHSSGFKAPSVIVMSPDLIEAYIDKVQQDKFFRGIPIKNILGENILIVGFEENNDVPTEV